MLHPLQVTMDEDNVMDMGEGVAGVGAPSEEGGAVGSLSLSLTCTPPASQASGEDLADVRYVSPHLRQISLAEYNSQAGYLTQQALSDLKASPEYKKHVMKCHSCGSSWYDGQFSGSCKECSGFAMHRPCPICHGYCGRMWQRNVDMSHKTGEGHWDGICQHQNAARLLKDMIHMDNITHGMESISTRDKTE